MLRVNVGLSRKLSRDYNSTGFSINLDGELTASVSDPEAVIEQVKELFDLAEETLALQIERSRSDDAIASRDEEPRSTPRQEQAPKNGSGQRGERPHADRNDRAAQGEAATTKQINYLLNIGRRQRLSTKQLEDQIAAVLGRPIGVYDLSKRDAATIIDELTREPVGESRA